MTRILTLGCLLCGCDAAPPPAAPALPATPSPAIITDFAAIEATTALTSTESTFSATAAVDGDRATAWCEGADGLGLGETLTIQLKRPTSLQEIVVDGGYFKDDRTLTNNGRPRKIRVQTDRGFDAELILPFVPLREHKAAEIPVKPARLAGLGEATRVTLTIVEADRGRFTEDTCISEIVLWQSP
jgi:hypothetical protein